MTERRNDDLGTPEWILDRVRSMGPIALDPCSNPWSTVGALTEWSAHRNEDGLAFAWGPVANIDGSIFVNPPRPFLFCHTFQDVGEVGVRR